MNVLVLDEPAWAERIAAMVGEQLRGANVLRATTVAEARDLAAQHHLDVLILEPAVPIAPGARLEGTQERVTLSHRVVASGFPGLHFARDMLAVSPELRVFVHTQLKPEHPDVLALREMGGEIGAHKGARPVPLASDDVLISALRAG